MNQGAGSELVAQLDALIERYHLLQHPFYQSWTAGTLTRGALQRYAAQYYCHVAAFPGTLQELAARSQGELRARIEENLSEELDSTRPHPRLWRDFAAAVGVDPTALDGVAPLPGIERLVDTYREVCRHGSPAEAVAALYAYEAQVPEIAGKKIEGLRRFYGITDPRGLAYFAVHEEADVRHRAAWRAWLEEQGDADPSRVEAAAEQALQALWGALDAVCSSPVAAAPGAAR